MPQTISPPETRPSAHTLSPHPIFDRWGALLAFAALIAITAVLARRAPLTLRLTVDGHGRTVEAQAGTVRQLLAIAGIAYGAADAIVPAIDAPLREAMRIQIEHARPVTVRIDGHAGEVLSLARTPRTILSGLGIDLAAGDRVLVNGRDWPIDRTLGFYRRVVQLAGGPGRSVPVPDEIALPNGEDETPLDLANVELSIARAVPVTIIEDGVPYTTQLAGATLGEALAAAGMALGPDDQSVPTADSPLVPNLTIRLKRGTPFVLTVDGEERQVRANGATVGEAVPRSGVTVGPDDYTVPEANTPLTPGMAVALVRVRAETTADEVDIPFGHEEQEDAEADLDSFVVVQAGVPGKKRVTKRTVYEDGVAQRSRVLDEEVLQAPQNEVVKVGTKVVWHEVETPEGPKRYWRKLRVYATSYSASRAGTPKSAPWYGHTRSGLMMRKGIVAIDTNVIPMRTNLYVPNFGVGIAGDTGGGVRGLHIDLGFDDDNYESWHQYTDVYLLEPLPAVSQLRNLRRQ